MNHLAVVVGLPAQSVGVVVAMVFYGLPFLGIPLNNRWEKKHFKK